MTGLIRTLLIWLLVVAVPAQAAAAVTMAFCGPNHQAGVAHQAAPSNGKHDHAAHHAEDSIAQQHAGPHLQGAATAPTDEAAATDLMHADTHKCSACASCHSSVALVSALEVLALPEFAATVFDSVVPSVDRFSADGLERPPRIRLV
jgi:hypothetical protein